ncbi:GntR family transcriptional regulator [Bifidobacterium platyrrhinorum]|uniref:UTRA domain-containing protein n=1 Tax=Bifidobacterium platyrrhinorum TaxID=2661628 RepID=A0A6L9SWV9_9BIFI|nr:GntR family transcriptional regulator [Bifidobacterium platyrrhinorum]NEG55651.1 UTRA domain-containing protein [Bifidobacterium platyrrhinorum]
MAEGVPKYVAVRDNLRQRARAMRPGEKLPAEPELCERYGVSRITLRHAIGDLIQEGLLVREQGRGTFRTETAADGSGPGGAAGARAGGGTGGAGAQRQSLGSTIMGFFRQQATLGNVVSTKVLDNSIVRNAKAAERLGLDADADLIRLERLRLIGDAPRQHVVTFLAAARFPKVHDDGFTADSLYEYLERTYAVNLVENDVTVRVRVLDGRMAWYFGVPDGTPVLETESTVKDEFGAIIAYNTSLESPDASEVSFVVRTGSDSVSMKL